MSGLQQPPQPSPRLIMLRPCNECDGPMLLMSAQRRAGLITKQYECFICRKTEEVKTRSSDN